MIKLPDCEFQDGSYPCGYRDESELPDCELCEKVRKATLREVVEWARGNGIIRACLHQDPYPHLFFTIAADDWEAKLKEWDF